MRATRRMGAAGWRGKHVVITGGSQGIGAAVAAECVARGAAMSLIARNPATLAATAEPLGAHFAAADVSSLDELRTAIAELENRSGPCDVLLTCAGGALPARYLESPPEELAEQFRVNVTGTLNAVHCVLPGMVARGRGRVVLVSSTAGIIGVTGYSGYAATKAAIRQFALCLRYEMEGTGVGLSVVYPPDTDTPGLAAENLRKPAETAAISSTVVPRLAGEVAAAIVRGIECGNAHIGIDPLTRFLLFWSGLPENLMRPYLNRIIRRARATQVENFDPEAVPA
ncbi:SDR family oxidoreductase [Mycobacterium sp. Dal123C01]|uniref:SDR family oxidoreductase n=1 Tax=Mycobacterium sp. Dal123C01 TaxID=3457577 RepID=UPI00403E9E22